MTRFFGIALISVLALGGCLAPQGKSSVMNWPSGPNSVSLADAGVVLDAPSGYCLEADEADRKDEAQSLFWAACGPGTPQVVLSAVVSGQATPGILGPEGTTALAAYFASERGRETLSRSGRADSVTVHSTSVGEGVVFLLLTDTSTSEKAGLAPTYWRAVAELNGHLVTFAALPFVDVDPEGVMARGLLDQFVSESQTGSTRMAGEGTK